MKQKELNALIRRVANSDPSLTKLAFAHSTHYEGTKLHLAELKTLVPALKTNMFILDLSLHGFGRISTEIAVLSDILQSNTTLQTLNLSNNGIRDDGIKPLAVALESNTTLQTLDLSNNKIGPDGTKPLAVALESNTTLQTLDLSRNRIGDGIKPLAVALESNTTLQTLHLRGSKIRPDGIKLLAVALESNTTLQTLNLSRNGIRSDGIKPLAEALESNTTLQTLVLANNLIGPDGTKLLAVALESNTTLQTLILNANKIGDDGIKPLAVALESNTTLQSLFLNGNEIGDDGIKLLAVALESNTTLQTLDVTSNDIENDAMSPINTLLEANRLRPKTASQPRPPSTLEGPIQPFLNSINTDLLMNDLHKIDVDGLKHLLSGIVSSKHDQRLIDSAQSLLTSLDKQGALLSDCELVDAISVAVNPVESVLPLTPPDSIMTDMQVKLTELEQRLADIERTRAEAEIDDIETTQINEASVCQQMYDAIVDTENLLRTRQDTEEPTSTGLTGSKDAEVAHQDRYHDAVMEMDQKWSAWQEERSAIESELEGRCTALDVAIDDRAKCIEELRADAELAAKEAEQASDQATLTSEKQKLDEHRSLITAEQTAFADYREHVSDIELQLGNGLETMTRVVEVAQQGTEAWTSLVTAREAAMAQSREQFTDSSSKALKDITDRLTSLINDKKGHLELLDDEIGALSPKIAKAKKVGASQIYAAKQAELSDLSETKQRIDALLSDWNALLDRIKSWGQIEEEKPADDIHFLDAHFDVRNRHKGGQHVLVNARARDTGQDVFVKIYQDKAEFERERQRLIGLRSSHVVNLLGSREYDGRYAIALEPGVETVHDMIERGQIKADWARPLIKEAVQCVAFIHQKGTVHTDIKPKNFLIIADSPTTIRLVLIDFDGACNANRDTLSSEVTGSYCAPERLTNKDLKATPAVDVWSLGVMIYEMLTGRRLGAGMTEDELRDLLTDDSLNPFDLAAVSPAARRMLEPMLQRDPSKRCSVNDVLRHSYLSGAVDTQMDSIGRGMRVVREGVSELVMRD